MNTRFQFLTSGLALLLECAALLLPPTRAAAQTAATIEIVPNLPHNGAVAAVTFSRDGSRFASGSRDHTIKLWDTATRRLLRTLQGHLELGVFGRILARRQPPDIRQLR